jgi:hypothetical protein
MDEIPAHITTVHNLKMAILTLDLPCSGFVPNSGEILTTGKSHNKRPDGLFAKDDTEMKKVVQFIIIIIINPTFK